MILANAVQIVGSRCRRLRRLSALMVQLRCLSVRQLSKFFVQSAITLALEGNMSSVGQAIVPSSTGQPTTKWYQNPQFWVSVTSCMISLIALVTRPEFPGKLSQFGSQCEATIARVTSGIRSPQIDASYDPTLARVIYGVQWATILAFVIFHHYWLRVEARKVSDAMPIAKVTLKQFTAGWLALWYGWLVLYGWFFLTTAPKLHFSPVVAAVSDVLDTVSGFAVWWCFIVLDLPSVNIENEPNRDKAFRRVVLLTGLAGVACALLGTADELFDINRLGVVVGLYNALGMAFLAGRFGSHFISLPRRILLGLYAYSMLQLFYSFLPLLKAGVWTPLVFLLALVFKIALAYAGYDMMRSGGLERYLLAAQTGSLRAI